MLGMAVELDPEEAALEGKVGPGMEEPVGTAGMLSPAGTGGFENCEADVPAPLEAGVMPEFVGLAGAVGVLEEFVAGKAGVAPIGLTPDAG